jgi:uncharacterized protein YbjT (DUF2867 family)
VDDRDGVIAVTGATGRQGGAVTRHLLADGWRVRALTREPTSKAARRLATLGADLVGCDMMDPASLRPAFAGVDGVYSVQNPMLDGLEAEVAQGRNVADAASAVGVPHLVYGSAGPGVPGTGVGSWESKISVAAHARERGLALTVLRPMAFMELMTHKDFFPPVTAWHLMPKLMGDDRRIPWLAVDDLGAIAAQAFRRRDEFVGADLALAADLRSVRECRESWRRVTGRAPRGFPMPVWAFERFVSSDLTRMWRWLGSEDVAVDPADTRRLLPGVLSVDEWVATVNDRRPERDAG